MEVNSKQAHALLLVSQSVSHYRKLGCLVSWTIAGRGYR
jgi:hypothetical protein